MIDESDDKIIGNLNTGGVVEDSIFQRGSYYLYISYYFSAWGNRMWEFSSIIFLLDLFPRSLLPSSLLGFIETFVAILFGPHIGKFIDQSDRLYAIRLTLIGQNIFISFASFILFVALYLDSKSHISIFSRWIFFILICVCSIIIKLSNTMNRISINKDWLVVLANKNSQIQTKLNANVRRIELICSIVAPLAIGILSTALSTSITCIIVSLWSFISFFIEFYLNGWIYDKIPLLHNKKVSKNQIDSSNQQNALSESSNCLGSNQVELFINHLKQYTNHKVFLISLAYCLLYISCLSFGGIMVAYLKTIGVTDVWLAIGRGIAAIIGILATYITPLLINKFGLSLAGLICIWLQTICLFPYILCYYFVNQYSFDFLIVIFVTICSSRFGLWGFDLIQTQLMQEMVLDDIGIINGIQESLINVCYLLSFILTMIFSDPNSFFYPSIVSFSSILLAAILFLIHYQNYLRIDESKDYLKIHQESTHSSVIKIDDNIELVKNPLESIKVEADKYDDTEY